MQSKIRTGMIVLALAGLVGAALYNNDPPRTTPQSVVEALRSAKGWSVVQRRKTGRFVESHQTVRQGTLCVTSIREDGSFEGVVKWAAQGCCDEESREQVKGTAGKDSFTMNDLKSRQARVGRQSAMEGKLGEPCIIVHTDAPDEHWMLAARE